MATKTTPKRAREKAFNSAAVRYLREVKTNLNPPISYPRIAELSGINETQVGRLFRKEASFTLDEFVVIAKAIGLDPLESLRTVLGKVED